MVCSILTRNEWDEGNKQYYNYQEQCRHFYYFAFKFQTGPITTAKVMSNKMKFLWLNFDHLIIVIIRQQLLNLCNLTTFVVLPEIVEQKIISDPQEKPVWYSIIFLLPKDRTIYLNYACIL